MSRLSLLFCRFIYSLIILGYLLLTVSTEVFTHNQADFRYVAYHDLLSTSSRYYDQNVTNFSRLYFDLNKNILIAGARDFLFKFSLQLDLIQKIQWEATKSSIDTCLQKGQSEKYCKNYVMAIHKYKDEILVCGSFAYSPNCSWRDADSLNLIRQERSIGKSPFNPRSNITTLVTKDGKMFIGSTIDFSGADPVILRSDLSNDYSKTLRTKQYNDLELYDPQFVGSFEHSDFIYFIFREVSIEASSFGYKAIYSRIARVCKNDIGGTHIFKDNWTSFLKARLNCSISGGDFPFYFDEVQAISFLADEGELYAIFSTPENSIHGSAICIFNISSIENTFNGPIKYQEFPGSSVWRQKDIEPRNTFDCKFTQKSSSNLIDSTKYQQLEKSVQPISTDPLYLAKLERFNHIAVTKISTKLHESVKIIFVSNENGYIKKISILPRTKQACLIEVLEIETVSDTKIETMEYFPPTQSLYIGTENSLMKIPSQRCSRHLSKVSCLNSMDPYCGWNDLTLSCTTAPNNDPLTKYWYQNSTMCPILTIPVDGSFSAWSPWFKCAKNDNEGYSNDQTNNQDTCLCRTRKCDNPVPKYGGKACEGHTIQVTNCTVHGSWSDWSSYGACSQTCGVAIKVRKRTCTNPAPKHNGRTCVGSNQQEIYCTDLPPCPQVIPTVIGQVDGQWSDWSDWTPCSAPCGKGFRKRERKCNNPAPLNNGLECIGCNIEYEECSKQTCNEVKKLGSWTQWLVMNSSEYGHMEKRYRYMCKAPISDPSELKISLFKEETRVCKKNDIVCQRVHLATKAAWGCWTDFSPCSVTCGKGRRVRYRKCLSSNGDIVDDRECGDGPSVQDEICHNYSCDSSKECEGTNIHDCSEKFQEKILSSSIGIHWIFILIILFTILCCCVTFFITKNLTERKAHRSRSIGSPHYLSSFPNQYSSLPTKDCIENNKTKRQPSFSGSTSRFKVPNSQGTLTKSNNNLINQNTPKILKFQNDTDISTMKRNSALNNMRLKQLEDDKDKY